MTLEADYITAVEAENELLRERVAQLEAMLGLRFDAPVEFDLTPKESKIFGMLMKRELATKETLMQVLYADQVEEPEMKIVDVFVHKIRKKLERFGIPIETKWGLGWYMTADAKATARDVLSRMTTTSEGANA
jgi:two-component system cell cycle response regulator CtrA